jgi:diaminohydroxyphosphoribosylaminopyrimidine deaminase/5-amino-6-(5-phosphoribosylamino)uracil reductase
LKSKLVKSASGDLLVFTAQPLDSRPATALRKAGAELVRITGTKRPDLSAVLAELGRMNILSVIIEAGPRVNAAALAAGVVDKMTLFVAPRVMGDDALPLAGAPYASLGKLPALAEVSLRHLGPDILVEGYLRDVYRNH